MGFELVAALSRRINDELSRVIVSKDDVKEALFVCLVAGGHVLIEGMPGTAKTRLAESFARVLGGTFKRIQLTPDMMPADITGFYAYSMNGDPRFVQGPIFANVVLADELNRTTPRTQSALLEAMQECQVSIEGKTFPLARPFMVVATQVFAGGEGTYPLTDVQADRFMLRVLSGYPRPEEEREILKGIDRIERTEVKAVVGLDEINEIQRTVADVQVSDPVIDYIVSLIGRMRADPDILSGPSPRAGIALLKGSRVLALLDGRDFVIPDDVKHLVPLALDHRVTVRPEAEMDGLTARTVVQRAVESVQVPK